MHLSCETHLNQQMGIDAEPDSEPSPNPQAAEPTPESGEQAIPPTSEPPKVALRPHSNWHWLQLPPPQGGES